jgi:hypothetical protein
MKVMTKHPENLVNDETSGTFPTENDPNLQFQSSAISVTMQVIIQEGYLAGLRTQGGGWMVGINFALLLFLKAIMIQKMRWKYIL